MSLESGMPHRDSQPAAIGRAVSAIEPLAADPNVRRVKVGSRTVAMLRASDVEVLKLRTGTRWTRELADRSERLQSMVKARAAALKILGRRARSRAELVDRLIRKGHERSVAIDVADQLQADGWIDDRAYASAVIDQIQRTRPAGRRLIRDALARRQVDGFIAEEAAIASAGDPLQSAVALARSKLATMRALPKAKAVRRTAGMLARRGFEDDVIQAVLAKLGLLDES